MARIKFTGLDAYMSKLTALEASTDQVVGAALYAGGEVMADSIRQELEALPVGEGWGTPEHLLPGPTEAQKQALLDSFGVAKIRNDNGFINIKLGFDGYNRIKTKRWPRGQPNQMVARAVERGTSFMSANPFLKNGAAKARAKAKKAMQEAADKEIENITKG